MQAQQAAQQALLSAPWMTAQWALLLALWLPWLRLAALGWLGLCWLRPSLLQPGLMLWPACSCWHSWPCLYRTLEGEEGEELWQAQCSCLPAALPCLALWVQPCSLHWQALCSVSSRAPLCLPASAQAPALQLQPEAPLCRA